MIFTGQVIQVFSFQPTWLNYPASPPPATYVTPYLLHSKISSVLYTCYDDLYLGVLDISVIWKKLTDGIIGREPCNALVVAPSGEGYVYVAKPKALYQGIRLVWQRQTGEWITPTATISDIALSSREHEWVWITLSGYCERHKVYETKDGGLNWQNVTGSLPNVPANTAVFEGGPNSGVYIGMDAGLYYRNDTKDDWIFHSKDLAMVIVRDLLIQPKSNRLIAATYGRGMWETSLIEDSSN
jgi:hypothetical protein